MEASDPEDTPRRSQAVSLHQSISADRWCVTRRDLHYLKGQVRGAMSAGEICPPADGSDEFLDSDYGPSIYTVTDQHIKPVTEAAGKMSWALMRNPSGLKCDLFISHAWQEGFFELMSKVMQSWPWGMRHAWCCMLANPQLLDISTMLQSPRFSPFAIALSSAKIVLAVPNRHCSIYTRLWCGYEAYLAQEQGKVILIARALNRRVVGCMLLRDMTAASLLGMVLALLVPDYHLLNVFVLGCSTGAAAWSMVTASNRLCAVLNRVCQAMCWFLVFNWYTVQNSQKKGEALGNASALLQRLRLLSFAGACCFLEVDRVDCLAAKQEAKQLAAGYQGSVSQATCSREEDCERIHREIDDNFPAVDYAIQVLLEAGMSTPALRDIASRGVRVHQAAHPQITLAFVVLVPCLLMHLAGMAFDQRLLAPWAEEWPWKLKSGFTVVSRLIVLSLLRCRTKDERCFIYFVFQKVSWLYVFIVPWLLLWESGLVSHDTPRRFLSLGYHTAVLFFALLGIGGTSKLPCGLWLLQLFFGRSWTWADPAAPPDLSDAELVDPLGGECDPLVKNPSESGSDIETDSGSERI